MFGDQQGMLNFLTPQLENFINNPPGFGASALSAMKSSYIGTVGSQLASQTQALQNQFSTENMAGLGSGVQAGIMANLRQGAAGQEATGLLNINQQNAQLQAQQQEFGMSALQGLEQSTGSLAQGYAGQTANLTGLEQSTAKGFYGQQSPWAGILGGLAGTAMNALLPGLGTGLNMLGGASWMPEPLGGILGSIGSNIGGSTPAGIAGGPPGPSVPYGGAGTLPGGGFGGGIGSGFGQVFPVVQPPTLPFGGFATYGGMPPSAGGAAA
jgi:hypothetical protein